MRIWPWPPRRSTRRWAKPNRRARRCRPRAGWPSARKSSVGQNKNSPPKVHDVHVHGRNFGGSFGRMGGLRIRTAVAAAIAWLLVSGVPAREPATTGYKAYEFAEYTLITRDKAVAQELPSQAAQTRALLAKLLARQPHATGTPNYIVYLPRDTWVRYFDDGSNSFAAFVPDRFANYLLLSNREALEELELRYVVRHAYT